MSDVFFRELSLRRPDRNLGIGGGRHGAMTGEQLARIEEVLLAAPPDLVLVYGDTNSTLAGALAAAKLHIPVAHVEAGLRSFNRRMPEEINRIVADHLSSLLFAPSLQAMENLRREAIEPSTCHCVGDVMFDAAMQFRSLAAKESSILERLQQTPGGFVLLTVHRQENTDDADRLRVVLSAAAKLATHLPVIWPVHPRTRKAIAELCGELAWSPQLHQIDPVGYLDMLMLESNAGAIATDSGGVQKEAFFFGVPCITLRDETEWKELIELGWNVLEPPVDADHLADRILSRLGVKGRAGTPYGRGEASRAIANIIAAACASL